MITSLILLITWIILGLGTAVIGLTWLFITGDVRLLYRLSMGTARAGLRLAGIRPQVQWDATIDPSQHYIFLSNHVSNLDPPVLLPLIPGRLSAFLKRSLMNIPLLGYGMRRADFIPVDRDGRADSAAASVEIAARVLASGIHIVSFVEGTRSPNGRLQPFKKGPFYLAMETGAPVIPVSIYGTETMMRKGSLKVLPGTPHVHFHATIHPRNYADREALMEAVRAAIASGLPEWMRG
jgi:1-acyl-sn-glycerol-3-phosphate acyltransferase